MPFSYPVALELRGRPCVVVGGGAVATHKASGLLEAGALVTVVAETFTEDLEELARRGDLTLVRRGYSYGDLAGAFVAVAATDDVSVNAKIFEEAERRRVLLNAVDDVEHCHFAAPSIIRRGDFLLAISTGGKAPALAKRLREELSKRFGDEVGVLVDLLGQVREELIAARGVDFATWARRWQLALDHDLIGLVREGRIDEAKEIVRGCLSEGRASPVHVTNGDGSKAAGGPDRRVGHVSIVGAGPGDPALLTLRGKERVDAADIVVYDRLVHPSLVQRKAALFVGKERGCHPVPQEHINALLIGLALEGKRVVRLKGGDPFIFGRGSEEAEALFRAGIEFEIVPAPTSAIAALTYAGIPVTDRRVASSVAFVTGHCTGGRQVDWRALATSVDTLVVLMGLGNLKKIVRELIAGGRNAKTPAAIVENGTLPEQRAVVTHLGDLDSAAATAKLSSPAIVVVGDVVRLRDRLTWFEPSRRAEPVAARNHEPIQL